MPSPSTSGNDRHLQHVEPADRDQPTDELAAAFDADLAIAAPLEFVGDGAKIARSRFDLRRRASIGRLVTTKTGLPACGHSPMPRSIS